MTIYIIVQVIALFVVLILLAMNLADIAELQKLMEHKCPRCSCEIRVRGTGGAIEYECLRCRYRRKIELPKIN